MYNSNYDDGFGKNIFYAYSIDGIFQGYLKFQGSSKAGDIKAKNISGNGNLTALYNWFKSNNVQKGDQIKFLFLEDFKIELTFISRHD